MVGDRNVSGPLEFRNAFCFQYLTNDYNLSVSANQSSGTRYLPQIRSGCSYTQEEIDSVEKSDISPAVPRSITASAHSRVKAPRERLFTGKYLSKLLVLQNGGNHLAENGNQPSQKYHDIVEGLQGDQRLGLL